MPLTPCSMPYALCPMPHALHATDHGQQATDTIVSKLGSRTLLLIALTFAKHVKFAIRLLNVEIGAKIRGCKNKA